MGFCAKDEPACPVAERPETAMLSRARNARPQNAIPPIVTVGIGHRFYSPSLGRWLSRDPIGEEMFLGNFIRGRTEEDRVRLRKESRESAYEFVDNSPIASVDPHGLYVRAMIDSILREAEVRRGRGAWDASAQHCWAACRIGLIYPLAGMVASVLADLAEIPLYGDWARDMAANHVGSTCAVAMWPLGNLAPEAACDCCCLAFTN